MGMVINQRKYVMDLLKEIGKMDCSLVSMPIEANHRISVNDGELLNEDEKTKYQHLVGKMILS